jgi:hypothetical protein
MTSVGSLWTSLTVQYCSVINVSDRLKRFCNQLAVMPGIAKASVTYVKGDILLRGFLHLVKCIVCIAWSLVFQVLALLVSQQLQATLLAKPSSMNTTRFRRLTILVEWIKLRTAQNV